MDVSKETLIVKIQEVLVLPLQNKCEELTKISNECGYKELQIVYPYIVESIFGINTQRGWGLRTTSRSIHVTDFQILYQFLHPQGPLFQLCYKLIGDSYLRYDYPLSLVPSSLRQIIEDGGVPPFYVGKIQINPYTKERVSITLNPFEFYMYHFAYHLINPWLQRTTEQYDSVYLFLMEAYVTHFLPCDTSEVLPHVGGYSLAVPITWNVSVRSTEVPTVFRQSLLNQSNTSATLHTTSSLVQQNPAVEVWRSEVVLHIFIDLWLSVGRSDSNQLSPVREREPSTDHIHILRNVIKNLHYFSNRMLGDMSAMDQLRRAVLSLVQGKIYIFLRRCMQNWPLDGSFRLLLELWLSYIQPWRYTDRREDRTGKTVDLNLWLPFMVDNLLCYTVIFEQLLPRFSRIDLTSPKNAYMLFRLSKVFSQPQLAELLSEIEGSLNTYPSSSKPFRGNIKWQGVLQQQIIELEGYSFTYLPLFSYEGTEKIKTFLTLVAQSCSTARILLQNAENQAHKDVGFLSSLKDFFTSASVDEDISLDDRRRVSCYLETALHNLSTVFKVPAPDVPDSPLNPMATSGTNQESSFQCPGLSRNMQMNKKLEYQGDPDLQPVRSTEIGFLVRFLYQVSSKLNEMYGPEMLELYESPTLIGRMAQQVLCGPKTVRTFEKPALGSKKRYPTLIEKKLPPRISFRRFASRERVCYILFVFIAFWLRGLHPFTFLFFVFTVSLFIILLKALLSPLLRTSVPSNPSVHNNVSDIGLDLSSSF